MTYPYVYVKRIPDTWKRVCNNIKTYNILKVKCILYIEVYQT